MRWASVPSPGHRSAVLKLTRSAAETHPDRAALQRAWASALEGAGDQTTALDLFGKACARFPADGPLHAEFASALVRAGRAGDALDLCRRWIPDLWARKLEFRLLLRAGEAGRLAERETGLWEADPADPDLLDYLALKWRGEPERLVAACDRVLGAAPHAIHAVHHKAVALALLGRGDEAAALLALDLFLRIGTLDPPPPFPALADFNAALEREISANPTLHPDPAGHATRKGLRTATFPLPEDQAGFALAAAIRRRVDDYAAALAGGHPFVAARPESAVLKTWALIFRSEGHQQPHQHPGAWLTGVYYVTAPEGERRPGALRIGRMPGWPEAEPPWPLIDVEPVPGRLVLFPSFVPHETIVTASQAPRISVAFDVSRTV